MGTSILRLAFVVVLGAVAGAVGCNDTTDSISSSGAPATTGTPAGQPRSFKTDVIPILTGSCALSSCHGDKSGSAGVGIFLPLGDNSDIYANLFKTSNTAANAVFVVPHDPDKSYLYAKLTNELSAYTATCPSTGCGQVMPPPPNALLSAADIATVKTWITEGAANN